MEYPSKKLLKKLLKQAQHRPQHTNLLYNTWVLYFFVFLSALLILLFSATKNLWAILVFFLTGFVVSFFSRNMTVVLFFAALVSGIFGSVLVLQLPYLGGNIWEGMKDAEEDKDKDTVEDKDTAEKKKDTAEKKKDTDKKKDADKTKDKDKKEESSTVQKLMADNDTINTLLNNDKITALLGKIGGSSGSKEGYTDEMERLKLQSDILDKINQLEPFMNSLAKITESYSSYTPGK